VIYYCFRSKASNTSSPTTSIGSVVWSIRSPPATRLRSRQASDNVRANTQISGSGRALADRSLKGKAKAKVEFKSGAETHQKKSVRHSKDDDQRTTESDLTELEELEESLRLGSSKQASAAQPSPRRLRSKDRQQTSGEISTLSHPQRRPTATRRDQDAKNDFKSNKANGLKKTRVLPTRKAKYRGEDTKEEDAEDELSEDIDAEESGSQDLDAEESSSQDGEAEDQMEEGEEDEDAISKESSSEEEIDELASATSSPSTRRTPLRKRLRPRRKMSSAGPSDGDDEGDGGEVQSVVDDEMPDAQDDEEDAADMDDAETDTATERVDEEETIDVEPRKLRSGKIVGEEDVEMDNEEDIGEEDEDDEDEEDEEDEDVIEAEEGEGEGGDEDAEGELDEEVMDEEVMDEEGQFMYFNTHVPSLTLNGQLILLLLLRKRWSG
jgi:hypothetical protein